MLFAKLKRCCNRKHLNSLATLNTRSTAPLNQNSSAAASKNSTTRSKSSSKIAEPETGLGPGKHEPKSRKKEGHKQNNFSNKDISINHEEKDNNTKNITNARPNLPPSTNNKVIKDQHSKTCE